MTELKEKLLTWWTERSESERRTLAFAVPVILLMFLYLVLIEPITGVYFARKSQYERAEETLAWLYEQAPLVARMQNQCGARIIYLQDGEQSQSLAQNIARRSSINARYQTNGESVAITVNSAPGNRLLAYVETLACNGFSIRDLEIKRTSSDATTVSASLLAVPAAIPRASQ